MSDELSHIPGAFDRFSVAVTREVVGGEDGGTHAVWKLLIGETVAISTHQTTWAGMDRVFAGFVRESAASGRETERKQQRREQP